MSGINEFPTKKELMEATLVVLSQIGGKGTTKEINDKVAEFLKIPETLLEIEDENATGTAYSYKMRWVRTELKSLKKLSNPKRGEWVLPTVLD